jgi:phosphoribosylaminoimidazolecarboxamide formyltransferase/IMP cyclohydrolase
MSQIKRALLSVTDKSNLEKVAKVLVANNVEIISSGGTRKYLEEKGFKVTDIQKVTGNPEAFGGRMKTLSFQVSSGILYRRGHQEDEKQLVDLNIQSIDLIVVNLYEFEKTKANSDDLNQWIEAIDIGGPTMLRAAAKNFNAVTVLPDPKFYPAFIESFDKTGETNIEFRQQMAVETFNMMARYDLAIARALCEKADDSQLENQYFNVSDRRTLRYGENPHQKAYVVPNGEGLASANSLQGKELSYNNYLDADAAINGCRELSRIDKSLNVVTVVKHGNPCGQAAGSDMLKVLERSWAGDPVSAFGGIICFNKEVNGKIAKFFDKKFVEVIIAPSFTSEAIDKFKNKKNLRVIEHPVVEESDQFTVRSIDGGLLIQERDVEFETTGECPTNQKMPTALNELVGFGVLACKSLKSNSICLVRNNSGMFELVGAGMGNPNRLVSIQQSVEKAKENGINDFSDILLISDAFFPFDDGVRLAESCGIKHIVQPGGSIKDNVVIDACNELGMSMIMTGKRHFNH